MTTTISLSLNEERTRAISEKGIDVISNGEIKTYILNLLDKDLKIEVGK